MSVLLEITAIVAIATMVVLISSLRQNNQLLRQLRDQSVSEDDKVTEQFNGEQAEKWFEQGELKRLNAYCEDFIKTTPNSAHANWYYALSHYNQGDYAVAREYFEQVIRINPLWREGAVIYLQEITDKVGKPNTRSFH